MKKTQILYLVGKYNNRQTYWSFDGIFSSEKDAEKRCSTTDHFWCPVIMNEKFKPDDVDVEFSIIVFPQKNIRIECGVWFSYDKKLIYKNNTWVNNV